MAMRRRVPYLVLLGAASVALVGSLAWAVTYGGGRSGPHRGSVAVASCRPASVGGTRVGVLLTGMRHRGGGMMGGLAMGDGMMRLVVDRASVSTGRVTLVAQNVGGDVHELVVLPLATGQAAGQRAIGADDRVSEATSLGEASRSCGAGAGDGIAPGTTGWVTLDLKPGRYELVCNLKGHYRAGMYAELDVE